MGPAPICFENLNVNSLNGDLSNATNSNPPLFSLVNTFKFSCQSVAKEASQLLFDPILLLQRGGVRQHGDEAGEAG
jgi:hypothetical protein